jgi:hypothetical protein
MEGLARRLRHADLGDLVAEQLATADAIILGRRTNESWAKASRSQSGTPEMQLGCGSVVAEVPGGGWCSGCAPVKAEEPMSGLTEQHTPPGFGRKSGKPSHHRSRRTRTDAQPLEGGRR